MKLFDYELEGGFGCVMVGGVKAKSVKEAAKKLIDKFDESVFQFPHNGTIQIRLKEKEYD